MKVAFITEVFPVISEPFIIDQVADLKDRGIEVEVFSFKKRNKDNISGRFYQYKMEEITNYFGVPKNKFARIIMAFPKLIHLAYTRPDVLPKLFNVRKYGKDVLSLRLIYWADVFAGKKFDLVHCHFGTVANKFLIIRDILDMKTKFVTSFYGYDVSRVFRDYGPDIYNYLKREGSLFFVMSNNMKERVVNYGFDPQKVVVHPIGINVEHYPFRERSLDQDKVEIVSVGRFVEKKGFDDLLRAIAIVKQKTTKPFRCTIIGDGKLKNKLFDLTRLLKLNGIVDYRGYIRIEDIMTIFSKMHFFIQPSKTAKDGNME